MKKDAENTTEQGNEANTILCPVLGQTYNYFDDGKICKSRKETVLITEIIPFNKIDKNILNEWKEEVEERGWLYAKDTDYFVKGVLMSDGNNEVIMVRTLNGGWFGLGYWYAGRLDIDGSLTAILNGGITTANRRSCL
jgi:hypothetical protein